MGSNPLRRRRIRAGVFLMLVGLVVGVWASIAMAGTVDWEGNGTNEDGTCAELIGDPSDAQVWQFNLTGVVHGTPLGNILLDYSFDDGTSGTDVPADSLTGGVAKWFVTTDAGAALLSAQADAPLKEQGNHILTISHCTFTDGTTTTTAPEETTTTAEETTTTAEETTSSAPTTAEETTTTGGVVTTQATVSTAPASTQAAPGTLPVTGAGETALLAIGVGLFLAGLGLVALERLRVAKSA